MHHHHHRRIFLSISVILAWSIFLLGGRPYILKLTLISADSVISSQNQNHHRLLGIAQFSDPKSIAIRSINNDSYFNVEEEGAQYIIPEEALYDSKYVKPTIVYTSTSSSNNEVDHQEGGVVIDVISIGSQTRPEYLTAQLNTWAKHPNIRNFWGVDEQQDYDVNCNKKLSANNGVASLIHTCQSPMGWKPNRAEQFRIRMYAKDRIRAGYGPGWFCAQRRPGHILGWLQTMYQSNATNIPDILLLVDDDTSVDVEKVKQQMETFSSKPSAGATCVYNLGSDFFKFSFGGFGTFFNKASITHMTQPIYCDERQTDSDFMRTVCTNLQSNRVGERAVYQAGDSVFDIFYKYSALDNFCMHSDWAVGYMISYYSGGELQQLKPQTCLPPCNEESLTCHNQSPYDMEQFVLARSNLVS